MDGILVVDKPAGPTSHDVVARVRRVCAERHAGHCGTLDPEATGVLVVALGEATKLVSLLGADDKSYDAVVQLGAATSTADAAGEIVARAAVGELSRTRVQSVLASLVGARRQQPPAVSAIKKDGVALHRRVRRGEQVEAPERDVVVHEMVLHELDTVAGRLSLSVHSGKGFYVRALAVEIAAALGTVGHVASLRRTRSGRFGLERAVSGDVLARAAGGDVEARAALCATVTPLAQCVRDLVPVVCVGPADEARLRQGKRVATNGGAICPPGAGELACAVAEADGRPVALVRREGDELVVARGFRGAGGASPAP